MGGRIVGPDSWSGAAACRVRMTRACFKNGSAVDGYDPSGAKAPCFVALFGTTEVVP